MTTSYPTALDSYTNPTASDELDVEIGTRTHSEFHADTNDAIEAIEGELGVNPSGASATVVARLDTLDTTVGNKQPLDTDLTGIAALISAADKVPYSTGAGTWALTDFTAAGRALLDDADASAQRTTLGLGTMAVATATDYVAKSLFDANSVLYATTDNTPVALTVGASTIVGRKATGDIAALTVAESKTLLAIDHGADLAGLADDDHGQYVLVAGTRSGAQVVLQSGNAAHVPLIAKAAAAQTETLQRWQDSAGSTPAWVTAAGWLYVPSIAASGTVYTRYVTDTTGTGPYIDSISTSMSIINRTTATNVPLAVKGMAAQSGNLQNWQNSAGSTIALVGAGGWAVFNSTVYAPQLEDLTAAGPTVALGSASVLIANRTTTTNTPLIVMGMAAQSGDLQKWQNSAGTTLAQVNSAGWVDAVRSHADYFRGLGSFGPSLYTGAGTFEFINYGNVSVCPLYVRGMAAQAADLQTWQDSASATLASVSAAGLGSFAGVTLTDATNLVVGSTTGSKIGTATTQKLGFWNATPVVQPTNVTNPTGGATVDAEARTAIDAILSRLETVGLFAA